MRNQIVKHWLLHVFFVFLGMNVIAWLPMLRQGTFNLVLYPTNLHPSIFLLLGFLLLIELNYQFVFKRFHLLVSISTSIIIGWLFIPLLGGVFFSPEAISNAPFFFVRLAIIATTAGYTFIYALILDAFYRQHRKKELRIQQSENELNALKAQLNPHFLFNTLNYLYGTALRENAKETANGIDIMSEMMRYIVTGMKENFVPIEKELRFIKDYLILQTVRLPQKDSIRIKTDISFQDGNYKIAPLILIPFIENAFKYGFSIDHPCQIDLTIKKAGNQLIMQVENLIIAAHAEVKGSNTGISNTKRRLDLLYPNRHSLKCSHSNSKYCVHLSLELA